MTERSDPFAEPVAVEPQNNSATTINTNSTNNNNNNNSATTTTNSSSSIIADMNTTTPPRRHEHGGIFKKILPHRHSHNSSDSKRKSPIPKKISTPTNENDTKLNSTVHSDKKTRKTCVSLNFTEGGEEKEAADNFAKTYSVERSHPRTSSSGHISIFTKFRQMITPSRDRKTPPVDEDDVRHEPYIDNNLDIGTDKDTRDDSNKNNKNNNDDDNNNNNNTATNNSSSSKADAKEIEEEINEGTGYYYETESGEVYYVDPVTLGKHQEAEEEEEEEEEAENDEDNNNNNNNNNKDEEQEEEEEENEDQEQLREQAQTQDGEESLRLKGKLAKTLASEESKERKKLQEDSMIVLADIGRTYRGLARYLGVPFRDEKALRHAIKHLEKDAIKQIHALEVECKKEFADIHQKFRVTLEVELKRMKKIQKST